MMSNEVKDVASQGAEEEESPQSTSKEEDDPAAVRRSTEPRSSIRRRSSPFSSSTSPSPQEGSPRQEQESQPGDGRNSATTALRRRSSNFFAARRSSFLRTGGQSGANPEALRGNTGSDFEGHATVRLRLRDGLLSLSDLARFLTCRKKKDKQYFVLLKGYHCFVFHKEDSKSPAYAIDLLNRKAMMTHAGGAGLHAHGEGYTRTSVLLKTQTGENIEYEFTFEKMGDGRNFIEAVLDAASSLSSLSPSSSTEQQDDDSGGGVRRRRSSMPRHRPSVLYAEAIGTAKVQDQPEAPVAVGKAFSGMVAPIVRAGGEA